MCWENELQHGAEILLRDPLDHIAQEGQEEEGQRNCGKQCVKAERAGQEENVVSVGFCGKAANAPDGRLQQAEDGETKRVFRVFYV